MTGVTWPKTLRRLSQFSLYDTTMGDSKRSELTFGRWGLFLFIDFDMGLLVWDLSPLWVILVVNEENGICGTKCMKFLPHVRQHVVFYLCRIFGEFLVEFTEYNFIIHAYGGLNQLVHEELPSSYHLVINGCVFSRSQMTWYRHS